MVGCRVNKESPEWPDIQLFFASAADNTDGGLFNRRNTGMSDDLYSAVYEPVLYKDAFTIVPLLLRPKSKGRLLLRDKNPYSQPLIHTNYLTDPHDIRTLVSTPHPHTIYPYLFRAHTTKLRHINNLTETTSIFRLKVFESDTGSRRPKPSISSKRTCTTSLFRAAPTSTSNPTNFGNARWRIINTLFLTIQISTYTGRNWNIRTKPRYLFHR